MSVCGIIANILYWDDVLEYHRFDSEKRYFKRIKEFSKGVVWTRADRLKARNL